MSTKTPAPLNNSFLQGSSDILEKAMKNARTTVNLSMVYAYYEIGKNIVEEEQNGKDFSVTSLKQMQQFWLGYSQNPIQQTVSAELDKQCLANLKVSLQSPQHSNFSKR